MNENKKRRIERCLHDARFFCEENGLGFAAIRESARVRDAGKMRKLICQLRLWGYSTYVIAEVLNRHQSTIMEHLRK